MDGKVILDLKDYEMLKRYKNLTNECIQILVEIEHKIDDSEILSKISRIFEMQHS